MAKDSELMEAYMAGFNDCPDGKEKPPGSPDLAVAYEIGWSDFIIGDDIPSRDYRSNAEVLSEIKAAIDRAHR